MRSQRSSPVRVKGALSAAPAFATTISTGPARSNKASTEASSVTSAAVQTIR